MKRKKRAGHVKGCGCDPHYAKQREARLCSCGNPGIGLDKYDKPVCWNHNRFPTEKVKEFPRIVECPGPHI